LGYFKLVKWGFSQNCPLGKMIAGAAKFPESLPFMKWARSKSAKI
jgi:hypothetical protein